MHITGMTIADFFAFTDEVVLDFDEHVNVFIGPNATGKSTILRALQYRIELEGSFEFRLSEDWVRVAKRHSSRGRQGSESQSSNKKEHSDLIPWVYFPATRLTLPLTFDDDGMKKLQSRDPVLVDEEFEEIDPDPLELMRESSSPFLFDGSGVHRYHKTATDLVRSGRRSPRYMERVQSVKERAYRCVQSICSEVLVKEIVPRDFIEHQEVGDDGLSITNVHDDMGIATIDRTLGTIFAGDLSSGTQGTLLWIWYLAIELVNARKTIPRAEWYEQPAILLIDEIENHLHPTWQRRVITALKDHFPGLQIFATTHSPFVVAGLKAGQVHLLNRDENGVVTASSNTENIKGWTADEILRVYMGVAEPTDELTAQAARDLRRLRAQPPVTDERGEEERQTEIRRLRQIVDRAELSGPRAAEDARFLANLEAILERYKESQDLNQENGQDALG